jgi:hypothetical protein
MTQVFTVIMFSPDYPSGKILDQSDLDVSPITGEVIPAVRKSVPKFQNLEMLETTTGVYLFVFQETGVNLHDYLHAAEKTVRDANRPDLEKIIRKWKKEYQIIRYSLAR